MVETSGFRFALPFHSSHSLSIRDHWNLNDAGARGQFAKTSSDLPEPVVEDPGVCWKCEPDGPRRKFHGMRRYNAVLAAPFENHSAGFFNRARSLHREAKAETCLRIPKPSSPIPQRGFQHSAQRWRSVLKAGTATRGSQSNKTYQR